MNNFEPFETSDGQRVTLRPVNENDAHLLVALFRSLSSETKRLRYNANMDRISEEVVDKESRRLSHLDPDLHFALIAFDADQESEDPIAVARFARLSEDAPEAEVAIVIRDDFQAKGLGRHLLKKLGTVACRDGIKHFIFQTTSDNRAMVKLVKDVWSDVAIETHQHDREIWATIC
ncbi:MAG: GNAT family N-acetyltransferase [Anaerolineae bacterium]|nr:GNAT family N-acetyltransferase [Anaerolineae bacterium]